MRIKKFPFLYSLRWLLASLVICSPLVIQAEEIQIQWDSNPNELSFEGAGFSSTYHYLPTLNIQKNGSYEFQNQIQVIQSHFIEQTALTAEQLSSIQKDWQIITSKGTVQRNTWTTFCILPFRKKNNSIEVLDRFTFSAHPEYATRFSARNASTYAANSVLSSGDWYKIGVSKNGIYKMDVAFFEKLGLKAQDINPANIRIFGHRGGMLPELAGADRTDDIREIPIQVSGQGQTLQVLAYLEGPEKWTLNTAQNMFLYTKNLYTDLKTYFITINNGTGKRITFRSAVNDSPTKIIETFDDYQHNEDDINNLLESGRLWLGPEVGASNQIRYDFNFPNIVSNKPARIELALAAKSTFTSNNFQVTYDNTTIKNISIPPVGNSDLANAANYSRTQFSFNNPTSSIPIFINYNRQDFGARIWPDFITINVTRNLILTPDPLYFRAKESVGSGVISQFNISGWNSTAHLWDVSDLFDIREINTSNGSFKAHTDKLNEYVAFQNVNSAPTILGKIENQNLHGLTPADYLIITRKILIPYAKSIGDFHYDKEGLTYQVVDLEQIFNEFSSGNNDLTAIRDFVKMFYDRAASNPSSAPKYLLLFGKGTFDNKNLNEVQIPSYQSKESFETVVTYVTDDYYGFLDDDEGDDVINTAVNLMDISIGRIPVNSTDDAQTAVDKIKRYYSSASQGDWRTRVAFIADDEDNDIHIRDANEVADIIFNQYPNYNLTKIYLDAFKQQSGSGGQRYPDANEAVNTNIYNGLFYLNFVGHGGPNGLTSEKVITMEDINQWNNQDKLFLFGTATCEFTRFDFPNRISAGERVLLNPNGGAIALVSTTRLVFSDKNRTINENFTKDLFETSQTKDKTLGAIYLESKNRTNTRENNRKFALFGDPALALAFPQNEMNITKISTNSIAIDTIKSLSKITIEGEVKKQGSIANNFNGNVNLVVYDKVVNQNTLGNDIGSPIYTYVSRDNVIYRGKAKAVNGKFLFTFIVPKDINYNFGKGKMGLYAENGTWDATGNDMDFYVGGIADSIPNDNQGPKVEVYMDDDQFVFGGTAAKNSTLLIKLEDESGINTSGTGLGHDITAILDEKTQNPINLNAFYEGASGDFTQGEVKYPFSDLANGRHNIHIKAWDVLNNSGEGYTEFIVEDQAEMALFHVLNYPNPFTTSTQFSFEHNRPGQDLEVKIEIYTVSGKLVKTLYTIESSTTRRISNISWDGLDDYGDRIGKGVYIYRVSVKDSQGDKAYKYQKLVLLR